MRLGFDFKSLMRLTRLMIGLFIYGLGIALMVHAGLGIAPWDVFAQGISIQLHTSYGIASIIVSTIVLIFWIPLKIKPGVGSIMNAILIGLWMDFWSPYLPHLDAYWQNLAMFLLGTCTVAFATGQGALRFAALVPEGEYGDRALTALISVAVAATIATAALTVYYDVLGPVA